METSSGQTGAYHSLMRAFGWYQSAPVNLTDKEVRRKSGLLDVEQETPSSTYRANSNPEARWSDMKAMAESELVGPILEIYAEETTQPDINKGRCLWYECDDPDVEKSLNDMLDRINSEDHLPAIVVGIAGVGNEFRRVLYNDDGVQQLVGISTRDFSAAPVKRLWDKTTRRLIGFKWENEKPRPEDVLYATDESIFSPWSFIHFRRLYRSDTEYGVALLDHLYPLWRKLEQSIDQMVTYRRHTMPTRHAILVDTQGQDMTDGMETIHLFAHMMRQQHVVLAKGMESRYNPPGLDSVIYIPMRGTEDKTSITKLEGDKDVPDIPDIENLLKQLYGGARVPKAYVGQDDKSGGLAQASLVSQDIRFARVIRNIRRVLVSGFHRLAQIHLILTGKEPDAYKVKVKMSRISSIEEEVNVAVLEKQAGLARTIADICQQLEIPNREIIDLVFREYLSVPRYFLDVAKLGVSVNRALGFDQNGGGGGGGGLGGFGVGGGGMGDDMFDGELGDDDGGDEPAEATSPTSLTASANKKSSLFERTTTKREKGRLSAALKELETGLKPKLSDSLENTGVRAAAQRRLRAAFEDVLSLHVTKKSSLVEDYTGGVFETEKFPKNSTTKTSLKESFNKGVALSEIELVESVEDGEIEAVKLKKNMKRA